MKDVIKEACEHLIFGGMITGCFILAVRLQLRIQDDHYSKKAQLNNPDKICPRCQCVFNGAHEKSKPDRVQGKEMQ
ncbi:MAG: hypothetical protein K0R66_866 [Gammaproteobacteria bacterium]|nr:hypothetical protein [Gammaproteobacteria bacterium]